jgi:hypothetical protein
MPRSVSPGFPPSRDHLISDQLRALALGPAESFAEI